MISEENFKVIVDLIEDGEMDDRMMDLQRAMDDRNERRKEDILKLVRSVWGQDAHIVGGQVVKPVHSVEYTDSQGRPVDQDHPAAQARARVDYVPTDGPQLPQGTPDSMSQWPTPIESIGSGGVDTSPVKDPMSEGGGQDPFGDGDTDIVSTGAQI